MTEQLPEGLLDEQTKTITPTTPPAPARDRADDGGHTGVRIHVMVDGDPILDTDSDQLHALAAQHGGHCQVLEIYPGHATVSMVIQAAWLPDQPPPAAKDDSDDDPPSTP